MKNIEGEIIVIDNNSTDDSYPFFQNKFKEVHFIWNETNTGFAKANNKALAMATGDLILFLNPDTIIPEDCFEKCISFINYKNYNCALGIKMLDGAGRFLKESKRAFPSPVISLFKLSGFAGLFPRSKIFSRYHLGYLSENENHEVDVLAGAFMMVPKKILEAVGGFDETFFMFGEDVDLSFRIQNAGFKNYYFAESSIIHFKGESTKKGSLNYVKMFYKAMSIFVKKHYGSTRAQLFNFLIQSAILFRACLAAIARFLKWVGLPVIDAVTILFSFWIVKFLWNNLVKQEISYSSNMLIIAFPVFSAIFLIASYFAGLYDTGYKQSRLNKSTLIAILVVLSVYSLLPEPLRFSRGILFFGSLMAFLLMTMVRRPLLKWKIIERDTENEEINQTLIAGTQEEFKEINILLETFGKTKSVFGRIETNGTNDSSAIGVFNDLPEILLLYPVKEIIFCEGRLSFKTIIEMIPKIPPQVSIKFFAKGGRAIIGSNDKDFLGNFISQEENFHLATAISLRSKNLFDLAVSFFFLLLFPVLFLAQKKPQVFFKNIFLVLSKKKSWVGYAVAENELPKILPGIITTTGLPPSLNTLARESLFIKDKLYAKHYLVSYDLKLVWHHFRFLSM